MKGNLQNIYANIESAAKSNGRSLSDITLVAVTKTIDEDRIKELISLGVKNLGENKVQELVAKQEALSEYDINWHFIGNLQTNKVKYIVGKVSLIHSVNSIKLANEINKQAEKINIIQDILLEINTSGENSKIGLLKEDAISIVEQVANLPNINLKGLMTIAPYVEDSQKNKIYFESLKEILVDINSVRNDNINMSFLSMGMTNDYEVAIEAGANIVRIGTGIFTCTR